MKVSIISSISPDFSFHSAIVLLAAQVLHFPSFHRQLQNRPHVGSQNVIYFLPVYIPTSSADAFSLPSKSNLKVNFSGKGDNSLSRPHLLPEGFHGERDF